MKFLAYLLSVVVIGLAVLVLISTIGTLAQLSHLEVKDYLLLIQVIMTFLTGLALAIYSSASARSVAQLNSRLAIEVAETIEPLKARLTKEVGEAIEPLKARLSKEVGEAIEPLKARLAIEVGEVIEPLKARLTKEVGEAIEPLKARLAIEVGEVIEPLKARLTKEVGEAIEPLKARLAEEVGESIETLKADLGQIVPKRHEAYHAMYDAASKYLKALRQFERKIFAKKDLDEADAACENARSKSLLALQEDVVQFEEFWQEATYIKEEGEKVAADPNALYKLWEKEHGDFGKRYLQLRELFSNRLLS